MADVPETTREIENDPTPAAGATKKLVGGAGIVLFLLALTTAIYLGLRLMRPG